MSSEDFNTQATQALRSAKNMNHITLISVLLSFGFATLCLAEERNYQEQILDLQDKFIRLDLEKHDMQESHRKLPPEQENERHRLMGALLELDPMNVLMKQLEDEILALISLEEMSETDLILLEQRKQFLALTASLTSQCESLDEAHDLVKRIRVLMLRGDIKGLQNLSE